MMALTEEQQVVYRRRLADAEEAWHQLQTGQQARVFVDQNGERIEYTPATRASLRAYIMELKAALGISAKVIASSPLSPWMIR